MKNGTRKGEEFERKGKKEKTEVESQINANRAKIKAKQVMRGKYYR